MLKKFVVIIIFLTGIVVFVVTRPSKMAIQEHYIANLAAYQKLQQQLEIATSSLDIDDCFYFYLKPQNALDSTIFLLSRELEEQKLLEGICMPDKERYHFQIKLFLNGFGTSYWHYLSYTKNSKTPSYKKFQDRTVYKQKKIDTNWSYIITEQYTGY